jgi:hypothetical protein
MDNGYRDIPLTVFSCRSRQAESFKFCNFKVCDGTSAELDNKRVKRLFCYVAVTNVKMLDEGS